MKMRVLVVLLVVSGLVAVGSWAAVRSRTEPPAPALPSYGTVPEFSLINHDGRRIGSRELAGKPYVMDFIFTTCTDFCPVMTGQMKRVRETLGPASEVYTVTITVDPENDKPAVMKTYAERLGIDPKWYYLTGERDTINRLLLGLHLATERDIQRGDKKMHNTRFILVDGKGQVRGYYAHDDTESRDRLVKDARSLEPGG